MTPKRPMRIVWTRSVLCAALASASLPALPVPVALAQPLVPLNPPERRIAVNWAIGGGNGQLRAISATPPWGHATAAIRSDPLANLRYALGRVYVIQTTLGDIVAIDPSTWTVLRTYDLGPGDAPVDIAVVDRRTAYVTRRGATHLLRLNLDTGAISDAADLSIFADADGVPDMAVMLLDGDRIYGQVQRLNQSTPPFVLPAFLAVVDADNGQLIDADPMAPGIQAIELQGLPPKGRMQIAPATRELFVGSTGDYNDMGGIERISLDTLSSLGLVVEEAGDMTGADITAFIVAGPDNGYLVNTTDLLPSIHLQSFTVAGGVGGDPTFNSAGASAPNMVFDPAGNTFFIPCFGDFLIGDGIHAFDATTGARLTASPTPIPGPASDVVLLVAHCDPIGDANGDGAVNGLDVQAYVNCGGSGGCDCLDLDGSGLLDRTDARLLAGLLVEP